MPSSTLGRTETMSEGQGDKEQVEALREEGDSDPLPQGRLPVWSSPAGEREKY